MELNQINECLPGHDRLHLGQKLFALGLLFGGGEYIIREAKLLVYHQPSRGQRSQAVIRQTTSVWPEPP